MGARPCNDFRRQEEVDRRTLLRLGSLSLLGIGLPEVLRGRALAAGQSAAAGSFGRAKRCILLFMWGGPSQLETWDLKPDAPAEVRGEFQPISTKVPGIAISEHFPRLATHTDKLAIVRSMTHGDVNHTTATHFLLTGQPPLPGGRKETDWPHLGSVLARLGRGAGVLPPFVSMRPKVPGDVPRFVEESRGQFAGWLGATHDPLTIDADPNLADYQPGEFQLPAELPIARLTGRRRLLADVERERRRLDSAADRVKNEHYRRAFELLAQGAGGDAFHLDDEPPEVRDRYGRNPHGQSVLQARRLIERGVPLVTLFWPNEGIKNVSVYWDTHQRNFLDHRERLMPPADLAFSALIEDLEARGLLDETLLIWTGEFGRTPRVGQVNSDAGAGRDGRDHWPGCFTTVLAGGGVRGGQAYGASDRHAAYPAKDPVAPVDLIATAYHLLGVAPETVLPEPSGRPIVICPGTPIAALL